MIKTKTFSQIIDEGYQYPEIIPEDLQEVIYDWYQYRHVCDDDKFTVFFDRLLKKEYHHYYQLLRIEPGIAEYDWLVSQYKELQRENTDSKTNTQSVEGTIETSESSTVDEDITNTTTHNTTDTGTVTRDNDLETNVTETITRDDTRTIDREDTGTNSRTDVTDNDTTNTSLTDGKGLTRSLPMSASQIGIDSDGNISSLDWGTASGQTQETNKQNSTGTSDTTLTSTGSDSIISAGTDVLDSDESRTKREVLDGGYTDTSTKSKTGTETNVTDGTTTGSKTGSTEKSEDTTTTETGTGRIREIMTGRNDQIALVMENAKAFIESTDAWEWLESRIDTVFMGVYEV